jgi:hypothetical protein
LPLATVIWTWTGPYRVSIASPAYVFAALEAPAPDEPDELLDDELSPVPPVPPEDPEAESVVVLGALWAVVVAGRVSAVATTEDRDVW